jgi:hypothetical protein
LTQNEQAWELLRVVLFQGFEYIFRSASLKDFAFVIVDVERDDDFLCLLQGFVKRHLSAFQGVLIPTKAAQCSRDEVLSHYSTSLFTGDL